MDLIAGLAGSLGLNADQSAALAAVVIDNVKSGVADESADDAQALEAAVPELDGWRAKAADFLGESTESDTGGLMGSLMSAAGSQMGQQLIGSIGGQEAKDKAALVLLMSKFGVEPSKAVLAAPFVLDFLSERVPPSIMDKARPIVSMLTGPEEAKESAPSTAESAMSALGGLFS